LKIVPENPTTRTSSFPSIASEFSDSSLTPTTLAHKTSPSVQSVRVPPHTFSTNMSEEPLVVLVWEMLPNVAGPRKVPSTTRSPLESTREWYSYTVFGYAPDSAIVTGKALASAPSFVNLAKPTPLGTSTPGPPEATLV
jgi:hypothetical protein